MLLLLLLLLLLLVLQLVLLLLMLLLEVLLLLLLLLPLLLPLRTDRARTRPAHGTRTMLLVLLLSGCRIPDSGISQSLIV